MLVSRRHFCLGSLALPALAARKQAPPQPSVLLIMVDELPAWFLGPYGNKEVRTPALDRLSRTGTRFLNHYTASPEPVLGRATLLTGRTPMQIGESGKLSAADVTLEKVLGDKGYACGAAADQPADQITATAVKFLDGQAAGKNFMLTVHYSLRPPYDGTPQKFVDLYTSQNFDSYAADKPAPNARDGKEMLGDTTGSLRKAAAAVSALDDQIGAVIAKLYQKQLVDNTLIIFTSTCGALFGRHGLWGCGTASDPVNMYDEVINTPMIMSWPTRIPPTGLQIEMVSGYDLVPTVCEFAGVELPNRNLCGRSYVRLAIGAKLPKNKKLARKLAWRTTVCGNLRNTDMAREERYAMVVRDGGKGPNELYDLTSDRVEKVNQYDNPEFSDVKTRVTAELAKWKKNYSS
jgi:arylsulfatase A-like enzyme